MTTRTFTQDPLTFGVEEEFLLADRDSRFTAARADEVIADVGRVLGERVTAEFCTSQLETRSEACHTAAELYRDLAHARRTAVDAAGRASSLLVASPCAVLTHRPAPIRTAGRYRRIADRLGPLLSTTTCEINGCHIHVGTFGRAEALLLSSRLRAWLPVVQALAANSPFAEGCDRNCASCRGLEYGRWPTVGPAPVLDEGGYARCAEELVASGTVIDRKMIYWYARPSEHLPTLEFRVADANADLRTVVLLAVLLRALAAVSLAEGDPGRDGEQIDDAVLRENHRRAARYGLAGMLFDAGTGSEQPVSGLVAALLARARPALEAAGDLEFAERTVHRILSRGNGAYRQCAVYADTQSLPAVVDHLAGETAAGLGR
ncbi:YbdK family carboxylate-amine ligase [Actinospica durhamensis]|uniref:Putative glutamate--cysteine ligase 2 n=1 Tax=Actinospica durhamensis TaxID=1508375 RepID=A0A941ITT2_9ACTN|nr:YbdK family carboxylate-amine ligase [Actinospica durhamensis]MBR7836368.1 YbdK family carboxylate-amine ligase [Actinospica durhamensis]